MHFSSGAESFQMTSDYQELLWPSRVSRSCSPVPVVARMLLVRSKQRTASSARERSQAENGTFMSECRLRKIQHERHFCSNVSFMDFHYENGTFMSECRLRKIQHERHFCSNVSFMVLRRCDT